jgi:hypothetical protein
VACGLGDCIAALEASGFDPLEEESLLHAASWLRRLGGNRDFLAEMLLRELQRRPPRRGGGDRLCPQVVMLSPLGGDFFLRANIWPSRDEHAFRASGGDPFVYGLPHDHNFDFLTLATSAPATGPITGSTTSRPLPARSASLPACASSNARGSSQASCCITARTATSIRSSRPTRFPCRST